MPFPVLSTSVLRLKHSWRDRIVTNAIVRSKGDKITYFGHELDACKDFSSLHFRLPFERVGNSCFHVLKPCLILS
jgi:hypothetical protein